ncbi:SDR family NAD(P)-dependent oxidoreductase [Occallatibacter riparius]|uniref:SDR family oxidoreductase n=1 Tax=Occallatibacter riparius TaxID=1002689 RepID=A0A9J7BRJ5_9BACT|nr:SDR family oxidoreductase [Occallatibacter riparius]UWZ84386.1 SDR family oxidoreductase [Occallatibacter riparius]
MTRKKTAIVTGASQGIGAAVVQAFLDRDYDVIATSRAISKSGLPPSPRLALVDGDIGLPETAEKIARIAVDRFGTIDHLVNNAGVFASKPFTAYTAEDFRAFVSTNLEGFIYISQRAVAQMLKQGTGGSVTTITSSTADHPIAGARGSIPMITKGGLNSITLSLAAEYAIEKIRFNAVAPGIVDTPMHRGTPKDFLNSFSPMGAIAEPRDIADAVIYLSEASHVTGEVLYVDDGAHVGKW